MSDLLEELIAFVKPIRTAWKQRKIEQHQQYVDYLDQHYPNIPRIQQIYLLENNLTKRTNCAVCGGEVSFRFDKGFSETCSKQCMGEYSKQTGRAEQWAENIKQKVQEQYSVDNIFQSNEIKEKIKTTLYERYGVNHPMHDIGIRNKVRDTNLSRYGMPEGRINATEIKDKIRKNSWSRLEQNALNNITILSQSPQDEQYRAIYNTAHPEIVFSCNVCGVVVSENYMTMRNRIRDFGTACSTCSGVLDKSSSGGQRAIAEFLRNMGFEIIENDRMVIAPKHLDIVIPEKQLAIEYNGLFYHSEKRRPDKNYHIDKLRAANCAGFRLISIFEDEWIYKTEIVKTRLRHILGLNNDRIFARKCVTIPLTVEEGRKFLETYHIQGYVGCRYRYGLKYNDEIVAVMTFSLPSIAKGGGKPGEIELSRYCSKTHVVGGAGKLLHYFACQDGITYPIIFSFADRRWSDGNLYRKLGFSLEKETNPNYWYIKGNKRIHRFAMRKSERDDSYLTEHENRLAQGFHLIWDCGSYRFTRAYPVDTQANMM